MERVVTCAGRRRLLQRGRSSRFYRGRPLRADPPIASRIELPSRYNCGLVGKSQLPLGNIRILVENPGFPRLLVWS
jgi:hypothetical protein